VEFLTHLARPDSSKRPTLEHSGGVQMNTPLGSLLEIERELARQRQGTRTDLTSCSNEHQVEFGKARDIVAKALRKIG